LKIQEKAKEKQKIGEKQNTACAPLKRVRPWHEFIWQFPFSQSLDELMMMRLGLLAIAHEINCQVFSEMRHEIWDRLGIQAIHHVAHQGKAFLGIHAQAPEGNSGS
jgi:hypothetical protein